MVARGGQKIFLSSFQTPNHMSLFILNVNISHDHVDVVYFSVTDGIPIFLLPPPSSPPSSLFPRPPMAGHTLANY